jgi:NADPH:quinone reductase-like Zn-dependent oxidoreductase
MLVEFGRASWIDKARRQPNKVRQVIEKIRTDGLAATLASAQAKLDQPLPLGYSNAGMILETGPGVSSFSTGDRVASNGPHGEVVSVPQNLCARSSAGISDDHA